MFLSSSCTFSSTSIQLTTFPLIQKFVSCSLNTFRVYLNEPCLCRAVFPSSRLLLNSVKRRYTHQVLECAYLKTSFGRFRRELWGTFPCTLHFRIWIHHTASLHNRQRSDHPLQAGWAGQQSYFMFRKGLNLWISYSFQNLSKRLSFRTSSSRSFSFPLKKRWSNA